jgi:hypothetical protein
MSKDNARIRRISLSSGMNRPRQACLFARADEEDMNASLIRRDDIHLIAELGRRL